MSKYLINYTDIKSNSVNELIQKIEETDGVRLDVLTLKDLVFCGSQEIRTGNGVYIFKNKSENIYVGKCSARNFVERISGHFDIRHNGWFNSLLRNIVKNDNEEQSDKNLTRVARYSFKNLSLLLINFEKYDENKINRLEDLLRIVLNPLNKFKTKQFDQRDKIICDVIKSKVQ